MQRNEPIVPRPFVGTAASAPYSHYTELSPVGKKGATARNRQNAFHGTVKTSPPNDCDVFRAAAQ